LGPNSLYASSFCMELARERVAKVSDNIMPIRLGADENFNNDIVRGLRRLKPELDIVRVQDVGLARAGDPQILEWAAIEGRILLTHDVATVTHYAYARVNLGYAMPGVFAVSSELLVGLAINEIILLLECSFEGEWEDRVCYIPL
jgi:hypothetical protein